MKYFHLAILVVCLACLMLAACGRGTSSSPTKPAAPLGPQKINITIGDFYIHSPVTTFTTGTPYLFMVTNRGTHHHDWRLLHSFACDHLYNRNALFVKVVTGE